MLGCIFEHSFQPLICYQDTKPLLQFLIHSCTDLATRITLVGAGTFFLVLEGTSFQPLPVWESPFPNSVNTDSTCACFSTAEPSGFCSCSVRRKIQTTFFYNTSDVAQSTDLLQQLLGNTDSPPAHTCRQGRHFSSNLSRKSQALFCEKILLSLAGLS